MYSEIQVMAERNGKEIVSGNKLRKVSAALRKSIKLNISNEELVAFSMGPWDMEGEKPFGIDGLDGSAISTESPRTAS